MAAAAYLIATAGDGWHVVRVVKDECDLRRVTGGEELNAALDDLGYDGDGACLGLPMSGVLAAQIDTSGLPRKGRRAAMLYRLEEQLPLDAEQLTAGFLPPAAGRVLGVAVETEPVRAMIERLGEMGIETLSICPASLLALWSARAGQEEAWDYAIICADGGVDIFRLGDGAPVAWYAAPDEPAEVSRALSADLLANPLETDRAAVGVVGSLSEQTVEALNRDPSLRIVSKQDEDPVVLAARGAEALLAGKEAGWIDLRQSGLAPPGAWGRLSRPLGTAAALLIVLLLALTGTFAWRGHQYAAIASETKLVQRAIFHNLYPNVAAPEQIKRQVQGDWRGLASLCGVGAEVELSPCSLDALRRIASSLPPTMRLRLVDVRVGPTGIVLEGQARNHAGAQVIAQALKEQGFAMEAPRTEQLVSGGVAFTLVGKDAPPGAKEGVQ